MTGRRAGARGRAAGRPVPSGRKSRGRSGPVPSGRKRPGETPRQPALSLAAARGGNAAASRAETRGTSGSETARHPRRKHHGIPGGNARHLPAETHCAPGRKCGISPPASGNVAGQRPPWPGGEPVASPVSVRRATGPAGAPRADPVSPRRAEPCAGPGGRAAPRVSWPGRPAAHFQITSSEIANTCSQHRKRRLSIHLHASYWNVISACR